MNHLLRELAPISDSGWQLLDEEARQRLTSALAARKLIDFSGPHGWEHSAANLGRVAPLASSPSEAVSGVQRRVLPLVELRADFELSLDELRDADRGADDPDLTALDDAAHAIASAENIAVFEGWHDASPASARPRRTNRSRPGTRPAAIRGRWPALSSVCCTAGSPGLTGWHSQASTTAW